MTVIPLLASQVDQPILPVPCGLPGINPEGWPGQGPEKAQAPHVQLLWDSLPRAHSTQEPPGSVLSLLFTTGWLQGASSLYPMAHQA